MSRVMNAQRRLTIEWEDPVPSAHLGLGRPMSAATGRVLCEGTVLHRGGSVATAEGRLRAESDGRLLAHGTTTCMILQPQPQDSSPPR